MEEAMNNDVVPGFDEVKIENFKVRLSRVAAVKGGIVLHCSGRLDLYNTHQFQQALAKVRAAGFERLILDLRDVPYMSSLPIARLVALLRDTRQAGGDLVLLGVQSLVIDILNLLGFASFFTITATLEESVARLAPPVDAPPFPRIFACPVCARKLRARMAGRFRCVSCRTVLALAETGAVNLG
jgi:anti-anti-sigma factor